MITLPLGFVLTVFVMVYSMGSSSLGMYMNAHATTIVLGGTVTVLIFSNPARTLVNLARQIGGLFGRHLQMTDVRDQLTALSKNKSSGSKAEDEFIAYAQDLWSQGVSQELFIVLISQKRQEIEQRSIDAIQSLKNLAKYPPALGMAGTVIGVVSLFQALDSNKDKLGASLGLAMTATFFGLVVANALVMPLADRLQIRQIEQRQYLQNVYQILLLINQEEATELIADEVSLRGA